MIFEDVVAHALRSMTAHRQRSLLTMLGITIGIASVILLTSIGEGHPGVYVLGQFTQFGTNLIAINPGKVETTGMASSLGGTIHPRPWGTRRPCPACPAWKKWCRSPWARRPWRRRADPQRAGVRALRLRARGVPDVGARGALPPPGDPRYGAPLAVLGPTLKRELFGERTPAIRPRGRTAFSHHRGHGAQGAVPRHRHRRHDLHPGQPGHGPVEPRRSPRDRPPRLQRVGHWTPWWPDPARAHGPARRRGGLHDHHADGDAGEPRSDTPHRERGGGGDRGHLAPRGRHRHPHHDVDLGDGAHVGDRAGQALGATPGQILGMYLVEARSSPPRAGSWAWPRDWAWPGSSMPCSPASPCRRRSRSWAWPWA